MKDIIRTIEMKAENLEYCERIAADLEKIVNGELYMVNGEMVPANIDTETGAHRLEVDDEFYADDTFTDNDGEQHDADDVNSLDEVETATIYDYFSDALDIEYTINADRSYKAVRIMVSYGGPNVYINTRTGKVELYWWNEYAEYPLTDEVIEEIDEVFQEYYNC